MSLVGVSRPAAQQAVARLKLGNEDEGGDVVARNIRQVVERVAARKRQEVEMHVATVMHHAQARAEGIPSRRAPMPRAQPSEKALQARLASAAQAAAARAAEASAGAGGAGSRGDVQTQSTAAAENLLQAQAAAALKAAKQRAARPAAAGGQFQAQAAAALEAAKQRAARPGAGAGVTPVPEAALQARARQAAENAMERQRAAACENSVEAKILWAMAAATYRSATEDSDERHGEEGEEHDESEEVLFGNGGEVAMTAVTAMAPEPTVKGSAWWPRAKTVDEEMEVESPRKNFGGC